METHNYNDQKRIDNTVKLQLLIKSLPHFCNFFFIGIETSTSLTTRIAYAYDLCVFFEFLIHLNPMLNNAPMSNIKLDIMDQIKPINIDEYLNYLTKYTFENKESINTEDGKKRKLVSLRNFYKYFLMQGMITQNPAFLINIPKVHDKKIIQLENDEITQLLDEVEYATNMTKSQKKYHNKTKVRDLALVTLLLGTGIRVSECVGLNINDINFDINGVEIIRKGGFNIVIYFGDEVRESLLNYLSERKQQVSLDGHDNALFLSMQLKRLSIRSVEKLVKKYSSFIANKRKVTPHKLRSTYGTNLFLETGDIYLVADVLGHRDVNTTKKHYAANIDNCRNSANTIRLRKKD